VAAGLPGIQNFVRYANLVLPVSEIEADPLLPDPRYHEQFAQPQDHAYRNTEDKDAPRGTARKRRAVDISPHVLLTLASGMLGAALSKVRKHLKLFSIIMC
jgi:hypothetical protein